MASVICRVVLDVIAVTGTDGALEPAVGHCALNHLNTALTYLPCFGVTRIPMAEALNAPTPPPPIPGSCPAMCVLGPQISFQLGYFLHQPFLAFTSLCPYRATQDTFLCLLH